MENSFSTIYFHDLWHGNNGVTRRYRGIPGVTGGYKGLKGAKRGYMGVTSGYKW